MQGYGLCCEVTSSYATTPLLFEQRGCCLNNAPTKLMRGDYVAVCIYQFPLSYLTRTSMRCPTKRTTALTTVWLNSDRCESGVIEIEIEST